MSDNPIAKLYVLDDNGDFCQIEPSTIAGAVADENTSNNDTVQQFIDDGVTSWEQGIKSNYQYPSARLVYESLDEINDKIEGWYTDSIRYIADWDCTGQIDFSSIMDLTNMPIKKGYAYRVIGEETVINGRKFQDGDLIIINRDIEKPDYIHDEDVILLLGYGNEQTKISRFVLDSVPTYADLLTYDKVETIQPNSVMIVANDENHNDLLSFYEYVEDFVYDISFESYADLIAYPMEDAYIENYEYEKDSVNHIFTLNQYTGTLRDVPVPVVIYRTIGISIARVVHDENHGGETTYYRYNSETNTWEFISESQGGWVYMFSRRDTTATGIYKVKGSVATYNDLPTSGQVIGDVYNILDTGANYVWTEDGWDKLSETVDLSDYPTRDEVLGLIQNSAENTLTIVSNTYYNKEYIDNELGRIDSLMMGLSNRIDNTESSINSISNRVTSVENNINVITNNVSNLENLTLGLSGRVGTVESDITNIKTNINAITNDVSNVSSNVNSLAQDLYTHYYNINQVDEIIQQIGDGLPDQTGHDGEQLYTNGTNAFWNPPMPSVIWKKWDNE